MPRQKARSQRTKGGRAPERWERALCDMRKPWQDPGTLWGVPLPAGCRALSSLNLGQFRGCHYSREEDIPARP